MRICTSPSTHTHGYTAVIHISHPAHVIHTIVIFHNLPCWQVLFTYPAMLTTIIIHKFAILSIVIHTLCHAYWPTSAITQTNIEKNATSGYSYRDNKPIEHRILSIWITPTHRVSWPCYDVMYNKVQHSTGGKLQMRTSALRAISLYSACLCYYKCFYNCF